MAAEAALSFAVETLGKLLIEKAVFLKGVKEEVEWLRHELESMQCFLKDAAKKQNDSEGIHKWISDIREVAHDAEDAIEMFVLKVQSRSLKKRYGCFPNHLFHLNKVGQQIVSIRKTLKDIQERRERYGIQKDVDDQKAEQSTRTKSQEEIEERRSLANWKPDQQVVGLEEDKNQLLGKAVFEKSKGLTVAAILGMGGSGKSTLASKIYNHNDVAGGFEFRAWVVVSSEFNPEDVMKQILLELGISTDELRGLGSIEDKVGRQGKLKKKVHECLTGKRYFIVLDDVWKAKHWESLSKAFPDADNGSRLLLTSRNPIITMNDGYVHGMKPLDATESWDLFMRKVFGGNSSIDRCPEGLKKVGEEILKKCGGLPLAISVVGGLLAKKTRSKTAWEKVVKEMKYHLERSKELNDIAAILELSYQNLPPELKACFLCMGFFEEDAIVKAKGLSHIWVAQGLVLQEVEREEVAQDYLNELISRNMVQVKEMEYDEVKACNMHDLLRDLSIRKAKEEIDFEVVREEWNSSQQSLAKPRHRAIYCNTEPNFIFSTNRNRHLRSLFIHQDGKEHVRDGSSSYWKSFELLRVLDFGTTEFKVLPDGIGELTGLRYLKMRCRSGGYALRLPRSWAKLKNLEVLYLRGSSFSITIDKVILKMESLRHLYAQVESCEVGLENMRDLQTLHMFQVKNSSDVWNIQGMSRVSKLGIMMLYDIEETSSLFTCLSSLENLFHLTLFVFPPTDLKGLTSLHRVTRLKLHIIPSSIYAVPLVYFPPNLSHLTLTEIWLMEDTMVVLEKLPNLLYLKLDDMTRLDGKMVITSGGFPTLKVLYLRDIYGEWKMEIEESAMPELNQFIINKCPRLDVENVPERIKSAIIVQRH